MKRTANEQKRENESGGNGRAGCTINPDAILCRREVADVLGVTITHLARLRRHKGLPIQPRGKGYITGRALLEWIDNQNAAAN